MKTAFLLLLLMTRGSALTPVADYAAPSSPTTQQAAPEPAASGASDHSHDAERVAPADRGKRQNDGGPSDKQRHRPRISAKNHPHSPATIAKRRPKQRPNDPGKSDSAKGIFTHNEVNNPVMTLRPRPAIQPVTSLRTNVRYRRSDPVVIGGVANSDRRNAGTINGTHMFRRP